MPITEVSSNAEALTLTVIAEYPVPVARLWDRLLRTLGNWSDSGGRGSGPPRSRGMTWRSAGCRTIT